MVDIHSHVLFGIDDGAKNIEESIELLKQAKSVGYTDIVCSSHFYIGRYENRSYNQNFTELEERIKKERIGIRIHKGNEFALDGKYLSYKNKIHTINGGKYLLVELCTLLFYPICRDFFKNLLQRGIIPIFAHVERYPHIKMEEFKELTDMGVILQMNLRAAAEYSPKIEYMLTKGYISLICTDAHNIARRNYDISQYIEKLKLNIGEELFEQLTEINPRKIINNEKIDIQIKGEEYEKEGNNIIRSIFSTLQNKLFRR